MKDARVPTFLYCFLLILGVLQGVGVYPQLPEVMASHFTGQGAPNNWQPKPVFFLLMTLAVVASTIPAFIVPRLLPSLPASKINLPNKTYWLAPERRDGTWQFFRAQMAWFGCALLFVLLYAAGQAINANLPTARHFDSQGMLYVMIGFLLFCILWVVHLVYHFRDVPASESASQPK